MFAIVYILNNPFRDSSWNKFYSHRLLKSKESGWRSVDIIRVKNPNRRIMEIVRNFTNKREVVSCS